MTIADDVPAPRFIGSSDDVLSASIVLASASMTRRMLLEGAGVPHIVEPSRVDEDEIKISLRAERASGTDIAEVLAEAKAMYVSRKHPEKMVLGADQVLECDGETFDKPVDRDDALSQLQTLRGKRHSLISLCRDITRRSADMAGGRSCHARDTCRCQRRIFQRLSRCGGRRCV
jgi:septum formation protein